MFQLLENEHVQMNEQKVMNASRMTHANHEIVFDQLIILPLGDEETASVSFCCFLK